MRNPFDKAFFRFLLGFSFILATSFALMFFVGQFSKDIEEQEAAVVLVK